MRVSSPSRYVNTPYSFSLKPRPIARSRSAMLWAFDPVKYCIAAPRLSGGDQPQIGLKAAVEQHARLRVAAPEHALDQRGSRRSRPSATASAPEASRSMSPQVSQPRRRLPTGVDRRAGRALAEVADERGRRVVGVRQQMAAGVALAFLERLEDQRFLLRAHAAQRADAAVGRRAFEIVERADAELAVQRGDGLRADALQVQQVEDGRRKLGEQLAMKGRIAGLGDLADSRGQVLADAGNLAQPGVVERRELMRDGWRRCRRRCDTRES